VPLLHRLVEPKIYLTEILEVPLYFLEFRSPMPSTGDPIAPGANLCVVEHYRNNATQKNLLLSDRSLIPIISAKSDTAPNE
jgi:hypothetical protein